MRPQLTLQLPLSYPFFAVVDTAEIKASAIEPQSYTLGVGDAETFDQLIVTLSFGVA